MFKGFYPVTNLTVRSTSTTNKVQKTTVFLAVNTISMVTNVIDNDRQVLLNKDHAQI